MRRSYERTYLSAGSVLRGRGARGWKDQGEESLNSFVDWANKKSTTPGGGGGAWGYEPGRPLSDWAVLISFIHYCAPARGYFRQMPALPIGGRGHWAGYNRLLPSTTTMCCQGLHFGLSGSWLANAIDSGVPGCLPKGNVRVVHNPTGTGDIIQKAMIFAENKAIKQIVSGLSWVLVAGGGMSFWIGGRALHEFAGIDRAIGEVEGLAGAAVLIALGAGLRAAAGLPLTKRSRNTD